MTGLWKFKTKAFGLAFIGLVVPAHAESRFETGDPAPLAPSTHLDFTIIIPDYIYLGSESRASGNSISTRIISNNGTIALSLQTLGESAIPGQVMAVPSGAVTNSDGRLAFAAIQNGAADTWTDMISPGEPAIYSVSLP